MLALHEAGDRTAFSGSTGVVQPEYSHAPVATGIEREKLQHIGRVLTTIPNDFNAEPDAGETFHSAPRSRPWRTAARSTGPSRSRWPSARLLLEGHAGAPVRPGCRPRHVFPTPCRPARLRDHRRATSRCSTSRRTRRSSACTTRCSRSSRCSVLITATRFPIRKCSRCGRPSSAISPTARRSSSTSSSPPRNPSGRSPRIW